MDKRLDDDFDTAAGPSSADQGELRAFLEVLRDPAAPPIETHASIVYLTQDEALKLKKPVRFAYLDYSSFERRRAACEAEWRLNLAAAPEIYLGVSMITRGPDGRLALDEPGEPVDAVVRMRRFSQDALFDDLARRGALDLGAMRRLAKVVARYHERAPVRANADPAFDLEGVLQGVCAYAEAARDVIEPADARRLRQLAHAALRGVENLLGRRAAQGRVRRCHGDLHLRNIVMWNGEPVLFDALEFDEALATTDVLYDLAFTLMDLVRRGLDVHANVLLNAYLEGCEPGELPGLAALPLMLALRAGVRMKVALDRGQAGDAREAADYFALALRMLEATQPRLIGVGGLSGSGKSSVAAALGPRLAEVCGGLILRSDVERKALAGVALEARAPQAAYAPAFTAAVYDRLRRKASLGLAAGRSVIVDAVHARPEERTALEAVAAAAGAPFVGLWLDCPLDVRQARVTARRGDASDADAAVAEAQAAYDLGAMTWRRFDARKPVETLAAEAAAANLA